MIIAITGTRGFVGAALAKRVLGDGHVVRYLDRPVFSLDEGVADEWLYGVDVLIHCAFDFKNLSKNLSGSRRLFAQAQRMRVPCVLISSLSVNSGSLYGRAKKSVERIANTFGVKIVRPGLIYDAIPQGILGRIIRLARFTPILPIISESEQYTTHVDDLYHAILVAPRSKEPIMAAGNNPVKLECIITKFAGHRFFIRLPYTFLHSVLRLLEKLPLGVRSDNLKGLHFLPEADFSEARRLGLKFREF